MTRADARFVAVALAACAAFSTVSEFRIFLATSAVIAAIIVRSVGFLYADTRMVSLCQVSFAGIGGWTVGWLALHTAVPVEVAVLAGGVVAVPLGVVVGLPALRLRGVELAVVTLGFAAAIQVVLFNRGFPGARSNFAVPRPDIAATEIRFLWFTFAVAIVLELALRVVRRRSGARAWALVGQSERVVAAAGRSVVVTKLTAFAASAFVAGIGGGLLATQIGRLSARQLEPFDSLVIFALAVMAGSTSVLGAAIAGGLWAWLPELLRVLGWSQDIGPMVFAVRRGACAEPGGRRDCRPVDRAGRQVAAPRPCLAAAAAGGGRLRTASRAACRADRRGSDGALRVGPGRRPGVGAGGPGEVVGLIGPNGAGKSSLVDAVTAYVPADSGNVRLGPRSLGELPAHRRMRAGLSRTFQRERTPANLSVGEFMSVAARGATSTAQREWLLALFDLPVPQTSIALLGTADRRRLELVAAFCSAPSVALLDEPAAGLTDAESTRLGVALRRVAAEWGIGVLLISHDLRLVRGVCESVIVLDRGAVIADGPVERALADPRVIASYLGVIGETE